MDSYDRRIRILPRYIFVISKPFMTKDMAYIRRTIYIVNIVKVISVEARTTTSPTHIISSNTYNLTFC